MPATSTCHNCGAPKDPDRYAEYYCMDCETANKEARVYAARNGLDVAATAREALAARAHSNTRGRMDPRGAFSRIQTGALDQRLSIEPGSTNDPRRG